MGLKQLQTLLESINPLAVGITITAGLLFFSIVFYIKQTHYQEDEDAQLLNQVTDAFESELQSANKGRKHRGKYMTKWCNYWEKKVMGSGLKIPMVTRENVGDYMLYLFLSLVIVCLALFGGQVIAACFITTVVFIALSFVFGILTKMHDRKISGQVPGFLQSMRASIQNNALPQNALMAAIKDAPDDLYEEVRPLETELVAGGNLRETLLRFSNSTSVKELKFLMSCIVISVDKGINLDEQLGVIQGIIESRRRRGQHIKQAVSEIMPTINITSAVLPGIFLFMYVSNQTAKDYWFKSVPAWIVFIVAISIWFGGLYMAKKNIDKVEDLG